MIASAAWGLVAPNSVPWAIARPSLVTASLYLARKSLLTITDSAAAVSVSVQVTQRSCRPCSLRACCTPTRLFQEISRAATFLVASRLAAIEVFSPNCWYWTSAPGLRPAFSSWTFSRGISPPACSLMAMDDPLGRSPIFWTGLDLLHHEGAAVGLLRSDVQAGGFEIALLLGDVDRPEGDRPLERQQDGDLARVASAAGGGLLGAVAAAARRDGQGQGEGQRDQLRPPAAAPESDRGHGGAPSSLRDALASQAAKAVASMRHGPVASRRRQVKVQLGAALRHGMPAKYLIEGRVAKALFISWTAADRWGMVSPCAHVGSGSGEPARWTVPAASCASGSYGSPPTRWRPTPRTWRSSRGGSSSGGPGGASSRPRSPRWSTRTASRCRPAWRPARWSRPPATTPPPRCRTPTATGTSPPTTPARRPSRWSRSTRPPARSACWTGRRRRTPAARSIRTCSRGRSRAASPRASATRSARTCCSTPPARC